MLKKPNNFDRRYLYILKVINDKGEVKNNVFDYREAAELKYRQLVDACICGVDTTTEFIRFIIEDIKDNSPNGDVVSEFANYSMNVYHDIYK